LEIIFAKRLDLLIKEWLKEFTSFSVQEDNSGSKWIEEGMRHEIKSENNIFYLDPPL
jgi:hypothetical protein